MDYTMNKDYYKGFSKSSKISQFKERALKAYGLYYEQRLL